MQRGIALIQVLLITAIIGVLMLQLGLTARSQVERAQALADRTEAGLQAQSVEAAITYSLLTEPLVAKPESANAYAARWNFHGEWFEVEDVAVRIQDESGRYPVPLYGPGQFADVLESLGAAPARASRLAEELVRFQGSAPPQTEGLPVPPQSPLQRIEELQRLPGMDPELFEKLRPLLTLYPTPGFNPITAPDGLLALRLSSSERRAIGELRSRNQLSAGALYELTGIEADDNTVLAPGPALEVEIRVRRKGAVAHRHVVLVVRPYQYEAVGIWQRMEGSGT